MGKYFLFWGHYATAPILDAVKQGQRAGGRIIMDTKGL